MQDNNHINFSYVVTHRIVPIELSYIQLFPSNEHTHTLTCKLYNLKLHRQSTIMRGLCYIIAIEIRKMNTNATQNQIPLKLT